jgi:hypothetical protein
MSQRLDRINPLLGLTRLRLLALSALAAAAVFLWLLAGQVATVTKLAREASRPPAESTASVARRYFVERDYQRIAAALQRNNPGVDFEIARGGASLRIAVKDTARFDAWIFALYGLQGYGGNVAWEAESLCMGKCTDGATAQASVKAYTQEIRKN